MPKYIVLFLLSALILVPHYIYPVYAYTTTTDVDPELRMKQKQTATDPENRRIKPTVVNTEDPELIMMRGQVKDLRAKIASREAMLKDKLAKFKDQKKAEKISDISSELNKVNVNRTNEMANHLIRLSAILDKIQTRASEASASGRNTLTVQTALDKARSMITIAQTAVTTQSQNDYTVTISSENTAKVEIKKTRNKLFNDLKNTRDQVVAAREAVVASSKALVTAIGGGPDVPK